MADKRTQTITRGKEIAANFFISAPGAKSVSIAGTFNNWNANSFKLTRDNQGNWKGSIRLLPGRYEYRAFVDGHWADDIGARETAPNEFGTRNAVLQLK